MCRAVQDTMHAERFISSKRINRWSSSTTPSSRAAWGRIYFGTYVPCRSRGCPMAKKPRARHPCCCWRPRSRRAPAAGLATVPYVVLPSAQLTAALLCSYCVFFYRTVSADIRKACVDRGQARTVVCSSLVMHGFIHVTWSPRDASNASNWGRQRHRHRTVGRRRTRGDTDRCSPAVPPAPPHSQRHCWSYGA